MLTQEQIDELCKMIAYKKEIGSYPWADNIDLRDMESMLADREYLNKLVDWRDTHNSTKNTGGSIDIIYIPNSDKPSCNCCARDDDGTKYFNMRITNYLNMRVNIILCDICVNRLSAKLNAKP